MSCEQSRPEKRQRLAEQQDADNQRKDEAGEHEHPSAPPAGDQITAALTKIANHISNSSKFSKASQLLRQIIDAVDKAHRNEYFNAVKAAFQHPEHCTDPLLRKDYVRLTKTVMAKSDMLNKQQRAQLQVYSIWALLRNELFTDDSFYYNKVVAKIKSAISELSDADEEQEAAWQAMLHQTAAVASAAPSGQDSCAERPVTPAQQQQHARETPTPPQAPKAEDEFDPFGLNEMLAREEEEAAAAATAAAAAAAAAASAQQPLQEAATGASSSRIKSSLGSTWDHASLEVMKKQALLDCIITAKSHQHKLAWARSSVELMIEDVAKPGLQGGLADKFVTAQRQQLQELLKFVHEERAARKSGINRRPKGKGTGDYITSFEKAQAEWSSASWVSTRGKVGAQGDSKSQNWLG